MRNWIKTVLYMYMRRWNKQYLRLPLFFYAWITVCLVPSATYRYLFIFFCVELSLFIDIFMDETFFLVFFSYLDLDFWRNLILKTRLSHHVRHINFSQYRIGHCNEFFHFTFSISLCSHHINIQFFITIENWLVIYPTYLFSIFKILNKKNPTSGKYFSILPTRICRRKKILTFYF